VILILLADDFGCGDARPSIIKGHGFPLRNRVTANDVSVAMARLAACGCVCLYNVGGKPYYVFPNWKNHQRIRNVRHTFPTPDMADGELDGDLRRVAASFRETRLESESESNPNPNPNTKTRARAKSQNPAFDYEQRDSSEMEDYFERNNVLDQYKGDSNA